jgi:hypothetical protein
MIIKPQVIKQHELERPTFAWCETCGKWNLINQLGHPCQIVNPRPTQPWRIIENESDRMEQPGMPSNDSLQS